MNEASEIRVDVRAGMKRNFYLLITLLLCACASRPLAVAATPTPAVPQFCQLHVEGRWIKDGNGNTVILHGASLPTLAEMEASERKPERRLRELADAGARVVRLAIDESEITPTFVPAQVSPFVDQANALGLLVILAYRNNPAETVNMQADNAEEWLRLALTYLRNAPGVWFEPFVTPMDSPKWQAVAQRMVDVVRGFRSDNIIVINNPTWLKDTNDTTAPGLNGNNIVYGIESLDGWPLDQAPFILTSFDVSSIEGVGAAQIWTITADAAQATKLPSLWKSSEMCH